MDVVKIRARFDLRGSDHDDLLGRLEAFRDALRERGGEILATKFSGPSCQASIVYSVPLGNAEGFVGRSMHAR